MPGKRQPDAAGESIEGCGEFWGQGDAGKTPAGAGRAEASHSGSLCSLWRAHRSNIFPGHKQLASDFMKYPACPGAPAPDRPPPRMPRGQHASGSTGGAISTPAACVSPCRRRGQLATDRQAAARTQTLDTYGKRQPPRRRREIPKRHRQGGSRPMAGRRPQVFWAGFSGPGSKAGAPGEFLAAFRRSAARNLSRTSHHAMGLTCTQSTQSTQPRGLDLKSVRPKRTIRT